MKAFLAAPDDPVLIARLEKAGSVGRPLGAADWLAALERRLGRTLAPARRGPKPRPPAADLFSKLSP
jgi:putative transposase